MDSTEQEFVDKFSAILRSVQPSGASDVSSQSRSQSRTWPKLASDIGCLKKHYANLIIGSGYAGSIAASRLARAGQEVCLLERGKEMWPGQYPDSLKKAVPEIQISTPLPPGRIGAEDGFMDFFLDEGTIVWKGCGLGGGSLVNSGIAIKPDMRLFDDPIIPEGLRKDKETFLKDGYMRAEAMLQPSQYPDQATNPLGKVRASQALAEALKATGECSYVKHSLAYTNVSYRDHVNAAGLHQPACELCGDCNTGCNYGSKNTLLMNYIYDAAQHDKTIIFCQSVIDYIEPVTEKDMMHERYVGAKSGNGGWRCIGRYIGDRETGDMGFTIYTDTLIVGAGTLGTTEMLLRSRARGMAMSAQVGQKYGCDGDYFSVAFNGKMPVGGVGFGDTDPAVVRRAAGDCGPCITSVIDLRDPAKDFREGWILEDFAVPGCFGKLLGDLIPAGAELWGVDSDTKPVDEAAKAARIATTLVRGPYHGSSKNTFLAGAMAFDPQTSTMTLENDKLRIKGFFDRKSDEPKDRAIRKACESDDFQATFMNDPLLSSFGNRPNVHPFGGCVMGDSAECGAVNHKGQLFSSSTGTGVWSNLYVWDGSSIPSSLGVNPLMTISAIAERGVALMAQDRGLIINYDSRPHRPKRGGYGGVESSASGSTTVLSW